MFAIARRFIGPRDPNSLVYGVTSGLSAWALFRGQFASMAGRGWKVTVVADDDDDLARTAVREGVRTHPIQMEREIAPLCDAKSLLVWVSFLAKERPSVLNVGTPKAALLGALAGWLTRVPHRVYLVHGLRFEGTSGVKRGVLLAMEWITLRCVTDVVVVSPSVARVMQQNRLGFRPLLLVGSGSCNGMDVPEIERQTRSAPANLREVMGIAPERLLVVFVGRLVEDKGAQMLSDALHELDQRGTPTTLLVVGEAETVGGKRAWSGSTSDVRMLGWRDNPAEYVAASDVLVLPTRREGYPTVVLEANACGVPVVTTRATGAVDSVEDGVTGLLVDVGDARGLADALQSLHEHPEQRVELARRARDRVVERFRPADVWRGLDSIYRGEFSSNVSEVGA